MRRFYPGRGIVCEEFANLLQGWRFRMPESAARKTIAWMDMQIEGRRFDFTPALVRETRAGPGLVRFLVVGEPRVARL